MIKDTMTKKGSQLRVMVIRHHKQILYTNKQSIYKNVKDIGQKCNVLLTDAQSCLD